MTIHGSGDAGAWSSSAGRYRETAGWLVAHSPHAVAAAEGGDHRIHTVNAAFCRLMRVSARDVVGRPYAEVFPEPTGEGPLALFDRAFLAGEATVEAEIVRPRAGDEQVVWSYTVWPLADEAGERTGVVVEVSDRTLAVEARRQLDGMTAQIREINERLLRSAIQEQDWAEKAEAASRAKSDFLSMISHELRTPLTGIIGYTEVLETEVVGPVNPRQKDSLARIRGCSAHLLELIEDVLTFAQMEAGAMHLQRERTDVCALVRQSAAVVEPVAAKKGLALHTRLPGYSVSADTDPRKVRQILLNLLSNAVKFTEAGSVSLEVRKEGGEVLLLVTDTGVGIEAADLERVFEPFVQTSHVTTRTSGGTGLGLSISRALARHLGGDLHVESTPGQGTAFAVRLPAEAA
jgi:PAS domain S-box-containing protein